MTGPSVPGRSNARRASGFTLIEMIVVMVLLGLVTTLALPSMQRWYDAVQARTQTMEIVEALRAAVFAAGVNRREILMDERSFVATLEPPASVGDAASEPRNTSVDGLRAASSAAAASIIPTDKFVTVKLPAGWQVERVEPAAFLPTGLCRAGFANLKTGGGAQVIIEIQGPLCAVAVKDKS